MGPIPTLIAAIALAGILLLAGAAALLAPAIAKARDAEAEDATFRAGMANLDHMGRW